MNGSGASVLIAEGARLRRPHGVSPQWVRRWCANALWSSTLAFLGVAVFLMLATFSAEIPERGFGFRGWVPLVSIMWATIGVRIAISQPRNGVGWLLLTCGWLWAATSMFEEYATLSHLRRDAPLPLVEVVLWFNTLTPTLVAGASALALLIIPDGHLPSRRWQIAAVAVVLLTIAVAAGYAFTPRRLAPFSADNPFGLEALRHYPGLVARLMDTLYLLRGLVVVLPTAALLLRLRGTSGDRRRQLMWVATAGTLAAATFVLNAIVRNSSLIELAEIVALMLVPIAFAIAIARYRLYDIDRILNRAFVYGSLTALLAGLYVIALQLTPRLFMTTTGERSDAAVIITTLVIVAAFTPLRDRLQALVDGWLKAPTRGAVGLAAFRAALAAQQRLNDPDLLLRQFLTECVAGLDAAGGAIRGERDGSWRISAELGRWEGDSRMTVTLGDRNAGRAELLLGPRVDGSDYTRAQQEQMRVIGELVASALSRLSR